MCMCAQTHPHLRICVHIQYTHAHTINMCITHPCEYGVHKLHIAVYISLLYMCVNVGAFLTRQSTLWKRQWPGSWFRLLHNWRKFLLIIFSDNSVHWEGENGRLKNACSHMRSSLLSSFLLLALCSWVCSATHWWEGEWGGLLPSNDWGHHSAGLHYLLPRPGAGQGPSAVSMVSGTHVPFWDLYM